jgi:two-component system response regulator FlrC
MRLLIIGSLNGHMSTAGKLALKNGAKVQHVDDVDTALIALRNGNGAELILVDVKQPIAELMTRLRTERFNLPVVAGGIDADPELAETAIRLGAIEYLPLPPDADMIAAVLQSVSQDEEMLLYKDAAMATVIKLADQVASSAASVLITGESGTGKEVIARYLHRKSPRAQKSFISVNCAAIPENLLESELFGHEKGAFTGAVARRVGKFEEANGGTLLLDEISEMHPRLQAKLLRAIQEREIDRVGGTQPVKVDIRLLATSNRNLWDEVKTGNFREDLFFRLNVVNIQLPPLRERIEDILLLAQHFVRKYSQLNQVPERPIAASAMTALKNYPWRGNVRELENTMHRAVLLAQGEAIEIDAIFLPTVPAVQSDVVRRQSATAITTTATAEDIRSTLVGQTVADVERDLILDTLKHFQGNRTKAAHVLGISIRTLRNKLNLYGA